MYNLLGVSLALAIMLALNACLTTLAEISWAVSARRVQDNWPAHLRAKLLYALRVLPAAISLIIVAAFLVPSYLTYEPLHSNETVSLKLAALALCSILGLLLALRRGFLSWYATRRLINGWLEHAEPVHLDGILIPAYSIRHPFPVIAVVGIFRPRLFIAESVFDSLNAAELSAAVAHECGHLAARDNLKRGTLRACRDALSIVPAGRKLDRAWSAASEIAADEHAARTGGSGLALNLASALVKIARMIPPDASPTMPAGAFLIDAPSEGLALRVRCLLELATRANHPATRTAKLFTWAARATLCTSLMFVALSATNSHILSATHETLEHIVALLR